MDDSRHPGQDSPGKAELFGEDVEATAPATPEMPPDPVPATAQDYRQQIQELYKKVKGSGEDMSSDVAVSVQQLYEKARDSGEDVSSSVRDWAQADVKRIGTWDYMIVPIEAQSPEDGLLAKLKELGEQRWECFWVGKTAGGNRLYMKRPRRSYIQMATRAAKFIPVPSGNE
ncbi:MAG: hypothetical protein HN742_10795 [Lentisphaerae bacterium]|nr:hypothetical protein [Lentisphaerota bacterium]MBT4816026.1 hypothetical protein [Lentisphaerota bacterium]MBT5608915.1 hypothetical protein [Lentisphaerota bacterium]MBT7053507.1 hypothetical protein [Lentisphaerota bacterium]MBT7842351.1 hypothetical protein [Lentisphaerota bacterium]